MNEIATQLIPLISSPVFIMGLGLCMLVLSLFIYFRARHLLKSRLSELHALHRDIRAITAAGIGVGERVLELERRQRRLAERQEQVGDYDSASQSYEQAIRMAQNGASTEELMDVCGLSESEAELITIMHRLDKAS